MAKSDIILVDNSDEEKRIDEWEEKDNDKFIHSGHFMLSRVHGFDEDDTQDEPTPALINSGFDFETAKKEVNSTYNFGGKLGRHTENFKVDPNLSKLFECMTLAYCGKLTSPKFKNFKGLRLRLKDKLRLNNIIWREWHMQYIKGQKSIVCQFAAPVSDDTHSKPEAVVLEGKYWKRRLESVTLEYKKWRVFYKEKGSRLVSKLTEKDRLEVESHAHLLDRVAEQDVFRLVQKPPSPDAEEDFLMDFTDTLFSSLNQPFAFPNPREMNQFGLQNADFIQPGLVQLQPSLEDFMDTLEPFQDIITASARTNTTNGQVLHGFTQSQADIFGNNLNMVESIPMQDTVSLLSGSRQTTIAPVLDPASIGGSITILSPSQQTQLIPSVPDTTPQFPAQSALGQLLSNTNIPNNGSSAATITSDNQSFNGLTLLPTQQTNFTPSQTTLKLDPDTKKFPIVTVKSSTRGRNNVINVPTATTTGLPAKTVIQNVAKGTAVGVGAIQKQTTQNSRKDGEFVVPKGKPSRKHRNIAPAPATTTGQPQTYLAQLLTTGDLPGTYPGANFSVKAEALPSCGKPPSYQPIRPAVPTSTSVPVTNSMAVIAAAAGLSDFSTNRTPTTNTTKVTTIKESDLSPIDLNVSNNLVTELANSPGESDGSGALILENSLDQDVLELLKESPERNTGAGKCSDRVQYKESRRVSHISAEHKRRVNIKSGFDMLYTLIPSLMQNPNAKVSKAQMLQKTAEYCKKLKAEKAHMQDEAEVLRQEIESLNTAISNCQAQLPATGAPVTRQKADQMRDMFDAYVRNRTLQNWKFWIFSSIIRPLFDSFNNMVSTASVEELCRTVLAWLDQHCSLVELRPAVLNSLRHLSTTTSILSDPSRVPEQAAEAVSKKSSGTPL